MEFHGVIDLVDQVPLVWVFNQIHSQYAAIYRLAARSSSGVMGQVSPEPPLAVFVIQDGFSSITIIDFERARISWPCFPS